VSLLHCLAGTRRSRSAPFVGSGALDAFGSFTLAAGCVPVKLAAVAAVAPGAEVLLPAKNFEHGRLVDESDDGKQVSTPTMATYASPSSPPLARLF
jgi:hypothetical protein